MAEVSATADSDVRRQWFEACRYQIRRTVASIKVSDDAGTEEQMMVAAACRRLGSRLWELTAPTTAAAPSEPEAEDSLPAAGMIARGLEEPPTSRPRLRSPGRRVPRDPTGPGSVSTAGGDNRHYVLAEAEEIGAEAMAAVINHRPVLPVPMRTMVAERRGRGIACLVWEFPTEREAQAFRAGVLQTASTMHPAPREGHSAAAAARRPA